jgi:hypothetical protein
MRKKSFNLIFLCLTALFISSCNNQHPNDKTKDAIVAFDNCSRDCDNKEKMCWDEYDKCKGQAATEEQTALDICSHLLKANQFECKSQAISNYRDKVEQCERKLRICLGEIRNCREACGNQLRKLPDTK